MKSLLIYIGIITLVLSPSSAQAFSVAPGILDLSTEKGEVLETSLSLINTADAPKTIYLSKQKFEANPESGAPKFIPYEEDHSGLVDWLQLPADRITVEARTKVEVPITLAIPDDIPAGGYYGSVIFSEAPYDIVATNGATISAKTAVLLLLTIEGEINQQVALLDLTSPQAGSWLSLPAGQFAYRLQNQGNVHVQPQGTLTLKGLSGRTISVANANPANGRVLPNTTRTYQGEFGPVVPDGFVDTLQTQWQNFALGPVKAFLDLQAGSQTIQAELSFWVIPWQLLLSVLIVLILLLLALKGIRRTSRKT